MSDRINSFLVVLEENLKDEDAEEIAKAVRILRGVLKVTLNKVDSPLIEQIQSTRIINDIQKLIWDYQESGRKKNDLL